MRLKELINFIVMDEGSGLIALLAIALIVGLIIRNKGDNTMDTLSKGCGCLVIGF